jgi:hypothetical protein
LEAGHQIDWRNLNESRRILFPPFGDSGALLEELARYEIGSGNLGGEAVAGVLQNIRSRVAIHFVVTNLTPAIEAQIEELVARERTVILHLPRGRAPKVNCSVRHFEEA